MEVNIVSKEGFPGNINLVSNNEGRVQLYAPAYEDKELTARSECDICVCDSDDQAEINDALITYGMADRLFNDGSFTPEGEALIDEAIAEYNWQVNGVAG